VTDSPGEPVSEEDYPGTTVLAAALATFFFPLISLIIALFLIGQQRNERERAQLRTWAWAWAGWIAFGFLIALVFLLAVSSPGYEPVE
jgi:MFS family permease